MYKPARSMEITTHTLCGTCNDEEIYQRALTEHPEMLGIGI